MSDTALLRPMRPCQGCGAMGRGGPCATCEKNRGSAAQRGYGSRWAAKSRALRSARGPLAWCGDRMRGAPVTTDSHCSQSGILRVMAAVVDHIVPIEGPKDPLFWQETNWQGLCHSCHNSKRRRERVWGRRR